MNDAARAIVEQLALMPHPEGGFFRETFRAPLMVDTPRGPRAASTAIYFLVPAGAQSVWHSVANDEAWHFYAGDPLELHQLDAGSHRVLRLGTDLARGEIPQAVVPAGTLQAARPRPGDGKAYGWSLCGCTVAPGFDFADFELPSRATLLAAHPAHAEIIHALTR